MKYILSGDQIVAIHRNQVFEESMKELVNTSVTDLVNNIGNVSYDACPEISEDLVTVFACGFGKEEMAIVLVINFPMTSIPTF